MGFISETLWTAVYLALCCFVLAVVVNVGFSSINPGNTVTSTVQSRGCQSSVKPMPFSITEWNGKRLTWRELLLANPLSLSQAFSLSFSISLSLSLPYSCSSLPQLQYLWLRCGVFCSLISLWQRKQVCIWRGHSLPPSSFSLYGWMRSQPSWP